MNVVKLNVIGELTSSAEGGGGGGSTSSKWTGHADAALRCGVLRRSLHHRSR